jgi:2-hydroxy-3-keto-5-methylthiopentenyl-1-phosphate phosphatase
MKDKHLVIFSDFDGTITQGDTVDYLLNQLAEPQWEEIEAQWESGAIGSRQCMQQQIPLIRGGWAAIEKALESVEIDPYFKQFAHWCEQNKIPLFVVSEGLDKVIHWILKREEISVTGVFANQLSETPQGELSLGFPHRSLDPTCTMGLCKCSMLDLHASDTFIKVVIGDGKSDFCWAPNADILFAKGKLLDHIQTLGKSPVSYESFDTIQSYLEEFSVGFVPQKVDLQEFKRAKEAELILGRMKA